MTNGSATVSLSEYDAFANDWYRPPVIADRIREYKGYVPVVIDDAAIGAAHVLEEGQFDFGQHLKRHGGVVAISQEAYQALLKG